MNCNTKDYWDQRFASGDWETKRGRKQTRLFAKSLVKYVKLPRAFDGTILDFGCGLGDAMPVYQSAFNNAKLIGVDISQSAIDLCIKEYGHIAQFIEGDHTSVPPVDVIIASNIFEHLPNDLEIASYFLQKCQDLYIIVPYKEIISGGEHLNSYDETYFRSLGEHEWYILSRGWPQYGLKHLFYHIYLKNLLRPFFGKKIVRRGKQIMFHLKGRQNIKPENTSQTTATANQEGPVDSIPD
jgi:SAM-dependent methyltransferase